MTMENKVQQFSVGVVEHTNLAITKNRCDQLVDELVNEIVNTNDGVYVKGEYFGYSINRLVRSFLQTDDYNQPRFNSFNFSDVKRKKLISITDKMASLLNRIDPLTSVDELTYILSNIFSKVCVKLDHDKIEVYLRGMIISIKDDIKITHMTSNNDRDKLFNIRRCAITLGIIDNVLNINNIFNTPVEEYD